MEVVAVAEAGVIALLVVLWARERDREARFLAEVTKEWAEERGRLVAAIKSPSYLPLTQNAPHTETRRPRDVHALAAVGTVGEGRPPEPEDA